MDLKDLFGWVARAMGIVYTLMLSAGWLDEMMARQELGNAELPPLIAFDRYAILTHLLPIAILVVGIIVGWKRPLWGVLAFGLYALLGIVFVWGEWIYLPLISGPSAVIAALYALSMPQRNA